MSHEQLRVQMLIADLDDRRGEVNNRTTAQHLLINLNISAAAVVAGAAVTAAEPDLLLLLAPLCSALGMLWANHDRTIMHIGWYLQDEVIPLVQEHDASLWRWQVARSRYQTERTLRWSFRFPVILTFLGPPLVALVYGFNRFVIDGGAPRRAAFALAAAVTTGATALLCRRSIEEKRRAAARET